MVFMAGITVLTGISMFALHFQSFFFFPILTKTFFCFARRSYCTEIATFMPRRITGV